MPLLHCDTITQLCWQTESPNPIEFGAEGALNFAYDAAKTWPLWDYIDDLHVSEIFIRRNKNALFMIACLFCR